jgi:hypothetical protein
LVIKEPPQYTPYLPSSRYVCGSSRISVSWWRNSSNLSQRIAERRAREENVLVRGANFVRLLNLLLGTSGAESGERGVRVLIEKACILK